MLNIFVNTWGNYNEHGADGGQWITLPMDSDELDEVLENIAALMGDNDPEWFINDHEWTSKMELGEVHETDSITEWNDLCNEADSLQEWEAEEIAAAIEAFGYTFAEAFEKQQSGYFIFYNGMDLEDVAAELADVWLNNKAIPEFVARYFDYDAFARDLRFDGYEETQYGVILEG